MKKLMENFNKFVNEQELETMQEQEPEEMGGDELKQSYTFNIYRPGHYRSDPSRTVMYVENVPVSMLDTERYEQNKAEGYTDPERFLSISKEGLQRLGFEPNDYGNFSVDMYPIDQVPETIELTVPYNPRTGEFMTDQVKSYMIPKVVDAGGM